MVNYVVKIKAILMFKNSGGIMGGLLKTIDKCISRLSPSSILRTPAIIFMAMLLLLPAAALSTTHNVSIVSFDFVPSSISGVVGDTVTWTNTETLQHSTTSDNGVWDSGLLSQGQSYSFVFTVSGSYPYHCTPHPWMTAVINISPTGIDDNQPATPEKFELAQNYPNPFNAQTKISFRLSKASNVTLTIYDVLGQEIEVLVEDNLSAGFYTYTWNAENRPSSIFFYRLAVDNETKTERMLLLK